MSEPSNDLGSRQIWQQRQVTARGGPGLAKHPPASCHPSPQGGGSSIRRTRLRLSNRGIHIQPDRPGVSSPINCLFIDRPIYSSIYPSIHYNIDIVRCAHPSYTTEGRNEPPSPAPPRNRKRRWPKAAIALKRKPRPDKRKERLGPGFASSAPTSAKPIPAEPDHSSVISHPSSQGTQAASRSPASVTH
jgi:hypothetical protein